MTTHILHPRRTTRIRGPMLFALGLLVSGPATARQIEGLDEAVAYYHEYATSDYLHILEATRKFEKIAGATPDEWLPAYWTAFVYSQLALFADDERRGPYTQLAQLYYDRAWDIHPEGDAEVDADFYALKGLLMGSVARADSANAEEHRQAARTWWTRARDTDPENPMAWMSRGLNLIRQPETRDRAYEFLDRAIALFEPRLGSTRPNWGREFIDVWMGNYPRNPSDGVSR